MTSIKKYKLLKILEHLPPVSFKMKCYDKEKKLHYLYICEEVMAHIHLTTIYLINTYVVRR